MVPWVVPWLRLCLTVAEMGLSQEEAEREAAHNQINPNSMTAALRCRKT
jgi:hypothetical protein